MRINNLFEHDASMKRQAEEAENQSQNMASAVFESAAAPEPQQDASLTAQGKGNANAASASSKLAATRHRASIACASCRDRRIRVSSLSPKGESS